MDATTARTRLIRGLQLAYSGEWGAVHAYLGHRAALRHGSDRQLIVDILKDEILHRRIVLRMLEALGAEPDPKRERKMRRIGRTIGCLCRIGGWYLPMYGAARLESANIVEYEDLARLAWFADREGDIDELLHLAEVEWDHEHWLRARAATRWLWRFSPRWAVPDPRPTIRERFETFRAAPKPPAERKPGLR